MSQLETRTTPLDTGPTADCLFRRLEQLRRFLRRHGFSDYVAERAIDRVIRAALRYLPGGGAACPLRDRVTWLFGSALRAARQLAAREPACGYTDPAVLAETAAAPTDDATNEVIWAAMDQLTGPQRQAVYLNVMRGMTLAEAAAEMGCTPANVQRHRVRGLRKLHRILGASPGIQNTPVH